MAPYKKRAAYRRSAARTKYSVENRFFSLTLAQATSTTQVVVPPVTTEGKRKVAHLTINASWGGSAAGVIWALMYIPQGLTVPGFNLASGASILEPNQFVMNSGTFDADAGPVRISSRVTRILHSGDSIVLIAAPLATGSTPGTLNGLVRYAIAYD